MISSRNSRYPGPLGDIEAEIKMTGSARAKNKRKVYIVLFFENKVHFYPIILVNAKTTIPVCRVGA